MGRFRDFPVRIEVLSRFTPPKDQKRILELAKEGRVDLLIGTHKLLQKSMEFKDLGLLIIDEEQRFGVTHKERLKEMSRQVDVLTLSATPIPRTLNMALSGLRDMSAIEEPPADRQPVQTYVLEHDWAILEDAMRKELDRGGQIYYLHNRVESIDRAASRIQKMLGPEVHVVTGHGKMSEQELSAVMGAMVEGEADVLVCTTIIETGIDISNVNTLIVEDADKMGLAQLHQLRGRIGRSARRAYAYLTFRKGKVLQEIAAKRLSAIREYVEFGSGFRIAMRDLEIRGAGNLLGPEQSGYLMSVGYDLYLKLLEEAVLEERGEERQIETECSADLTVNANIPERYVSSPEQRMPHRRHPLQRRRVGPAGRAFGPLWGGSQAGAGPAGRGPFAGGGGQGGGVGHYPEEGRPPLPDGGVPPGGGGEGLRAEQVPPAPVRGRRRGPGPEAEAEARRGRAGERHGAGGGFEAANPGVKHGGSEDRSPVLSYLPFLPNIMVGTTS